MIGLSDGPIPWPIGTTGRGKFYILCGDLVKAVRQESNIAVAYWFGVKPITVSRWRHRLAVETNTPGTRAAHADARRGRRLTKEQKAKLLAANKGQKLPSATRQKMSAAHKARGTRPPWLKPAWTAEEDELVRRLTVTEAARKTGRGLSAVYTRRYRLRVPDARRR